VFPGTTPEVAAGIQERSPGLVQLSLNVAWNHEALCGGIQKSILTDFSRKRGRFSPNVDKDGAMAPRTGLGYPHEGPFVVRADAAAGRRTHFQTLRTYKLGINQNHYTFTLVLLIKIDLCSELPWTKFISYKCFDMSTWLRPGCKSRPGS
jgi:hypothetical protein